MVNEKTDVSKRNARLFRATLSAFEMQQLPDAMPEFLGLSETLEIVIGQSLYVETFAIEESVSDLTGVPGDSACCHIVQVSNLAEYCYGRTDKQVGDLLGYYRFNTYESALKMVAALMSVSDGNEQP